ncbi:glycosyltransferase family 2 protein [Accumulibacter sp.]|jgi:glycosyltransferase involved in cell wall biosynthesis|uniref:Glycosyl transferase family 2 n=1 Tax=Accumulibacter regalis TaxID=522306 RepID=C7RIV6_ACCRE|nr:glycosyltransferase family 2 protein [Accumulibacter sp.]MBN8496286.1 glycosyltransferase family 2 protein [Accumulibacter sp.]MBO3713489.1 glycosyltransferase family 2 protein [Accumulibacter sp.]
MYKNCSVAVVVPAYNEETQIAVVIESMPDIVDVIVIVNDCSKDQTSQVVRRHSEFGSGRIVLLEHAENQGVGGAIATGYKWVRDNNYDVAVVMAGDGQMAPDDLPAILDPVVDGEADYTKGNRLVTGEAFKKIPKIRFFGNSALSLLTKIASGYWHVADSQTGYTAISQSALQAIDWDNMYKRYGQPNDLLVKLNVANMRVVDVPIEPVYNVGEKSGIKVRKVIFTIGSLLVRLFFWRLKEKYIIRNFHPLVFFYAMGLGGLALSSILFVRMLSMWIGSGNVPEITFLGSLFSFSLSVNSLFFAMWFDYDENKHLNPPLKHRETRRKSTQAE